MTWTKLSDTFADECARAGLSDAAVRTHIEALIWTMRRETGGYIDDRDIRRAVETEAAAAAIAELLAVGFWRRIKRGGYQLEHHMEHQPEPDVIERRRQLDAVRQRRKRRKAAGLGEP